MKKTDMPISRPGGPEYYISGYRLTQSGYAKLTKTHKSFKFDLPPKMSASLTSKIIAIECPFYINKKNTAIYLFSESESMIINLLGSVKEWLEAR